MPFEKQWQAFNPDGMIKLAVNVKHAFQHEHNPAPFSSACPDHICMQAGGMTYDDFKADFELASDMAGLLPSAHQPRPPFAVISSSKYHMIDGELKPVRVYPWGRCVITDNIYSDFNYIQ